MKDRCSPRAYPYIITLKSRIETATFHKLSKPSNRFLCRMHKFQPCKRENRTALLSGSLIFLFRCQSAADMSFRFVDFQYLLHLQIEPSVAPGQPLCQVFVYGGFTDSELLCSAPDRCIVFDDVHSQIAGSFFHEVMQRQHSLHIVLKQSMCKCAPLCRSSVQTGYTAPALHLLFSFRIICCIRSAAREAARLMLCTRT